MPSGFATLGAFSTAYEANLVRAELEAFELHANLVDAEIVDVNWLWSNAIGGVKVQVPESEAAEARRILALEPDDAEDSPELAACPHCGSRHNRYFLEKRGTFLTWLVLGVPVLPALSRRICADCGRKWKPLAELR